MSLNSTFVFKIALHQAFLRGSHLGRNILVDLSSSEVIMILKIYSDSCGFHENRQVWIKNVIISTLII